MANETGEASQEELKEWSVGGEDLTRAISPSANDITATDLTTPLELGGNRLLRLVGRGGMGEVWLALDPRLQRHVAIKVMAPGLAAEPQAVARFYREARAVARLNHPNIVQIHQIAEEAGKPFFAMEWVEGGTLSDRLREEGPLALGAALPLLLQAVEGLGYACANGVIHRDVKPGNMLINPQGQLKIADFGLAKFLDAPDGGHTTATGVPMGSPNYMSPEQAKGEPADHRSDIYSLGITFYQMLTGQLPHSGSTPVTILLKHVQDPLPEPEPLKLLAGGQAMGVIRRMTAKAPAERYQSYDELKEALLTLHASAEGIGPLPKGVVLPGSSSHLSSAGPGHGRAGNPSPPPFRGLSARTAAILALVALVLGGALGIWIVGARKADSKRRQTAAQRPKESGGRDQDRTLAREATPAGAAADAAPGEKRAGAAPPEKGTGEADSDDLRNRRRPLAARLASRPRPGERTGTPIESRDEMVRLSETYDFAGAAQMMEGFLANRNLPPERKSEAQRRLDDMRTLAGMRKALTVEAVRQAPIKMVLPGRGEVTLVGGDTDGFRFQTGDGPQHLTWGEMIPIELFSISRQLLSRSPEWQQQERALRNLFPRLEESAAGPMKPVGERGETR